MLLNEGSFEYRLSLRLLVTVSLLLTAADIEVALDGKKQQHQQPASGRRLSGSRRSLDLNGGGGLAGMVRASRGSLDLGSGVLAPGMISTSGALGSPGVVAPSERGMNASGKGMVLPFTPLALTFHELNYYVDLPKVFPLVPLSFSLSLTRPSRLPSVHTDRFCP